MPGGAVASAALLPLEAAFRGASALRNRAYDLGILRVRAAGVPVVSVGNLVVGGAGKTPVAAWLARRLLAWGRLPAIAMRGYGGDEVLLHRELNPDVPVFTDTRRVRAAVAAAAAGRDVVVLDDGFQHRALARDLDLVLVPAESWTRTPRLLPRGRWREPPGALERADVVAVTRKTAGAEAAAAVGEEVRRVAPGALLLHCALMPDRLSPLHGGAADRPLDSLVGASVLAVAAIARPGPFIAHLRDTGAEVDAVLHADHHPYGAGEAAALVARAAGRPLVTTRKDAVKLRPLLSPGVDAWVMEQSVTIDRGLEALDGALRRALAAHPA
jgi:tetraacyldisaccharide 4'-kinase